MNKTKIDWPGLDYTWNPITGCKRGCSYCYARRNWNRLHRKREGCEFDIIKLHPDRLQEPFKKTPSTIFVGSMSDPEYWSADHWRFLIDIFSRANWHTYMLLSKNPLSYYNRGIEYNVMQGLTIDCTQTKHCQYDMLEEISKYPRPFLSVEPLLGEIACADYSKFRIVIVGAMTGWGAIKPQMEWIDSIKKNVSKEKIYWKNSMKEYL